MKKHIYFLLFTLFLFKSKAQLLPGIGLNTMPANNATICVEPFYLGNFYVTGYQQGDTVPDFKLYGLSGDSIILSQELANGKPVLLIAGSLTCPVFRAKITAINQIVSTYSSNIKVFVINTLEAHPTDTSVYSGNINVTSQNVTAGILFPQPQTYGARKQMVDTMSSYLTLNAPVFIDGPCNNWWKNFGPAPNNSYLIGTNGVVLNKHGWFHKSPDNIFCDLDSILNVTSGLCVPTTTAQGNFNLNVLNANVNGNPGDLMYDYFDVINTTSVVTTVKIKKLQKALPAGWQTAFCADICYSTLDDSIEVNLDPFTTSHYSIDFFTDAIADSGSIKLGFKNVNKPSNSFSVWLRASTLPGSVGIISNSNSKTNFELYPNPATNKVSLITEEINYAVKAYDLLGSEKEIVISNNSLSTESWKNGIYFIVIKSPKGSLTKKVIIDK
ncbi:MAG: T9SS type A sorting domain-containing protein [Bacteroidota bacterium]|nr:T9SS type A sorting domain-containing protein [Bacteroidota bacterium]